MKSPARFRRDPRSLKLALALLGLGLLILQPALAKQDDRNQPMNYSSKKLDGFNAPNTVTTLTGNVVMTQGTMKLTGAVAKMYLDADTQVARAVVNGNLAHIEQLDDAGNLMQGDALQLDLRFLCDLVPTRRATKPDMRRGAGGFQIRKFAPRQHIYH